MPFQFSLHAVLRLRQSRERQQEIILQTTLGYAALVRHKLQDIDSTIDQLRDAERNGLKLGLKASELQFEIARAATLQSSRRQLELELAEAEKECREKAAELRLAKRQTETIQILRQQQLELHLQEESRREQRRLDDAYLSRRIFLSIDE